MQQHNPIDRWLCGRTPQPQLRGVRRFALEFWFFGLKEVRACLFAGLFFAAMAVIPKSGIFGLPRYDALLLFALAAQAAMLYGGLETRDEVKSITLFHLVGFMLELFKTSPGIQAALLPETATVRASWAYPDFAYTKIGGVPLFSGFMYAAVASYMIQAWRLFDMRVVRHPPYWLATLAAAAVYLNFFTHHAMPDMRWYLTAFILGLYAHSFVVFTPYDMPRRMPLLCAFILIGFFIWLAENISTFIGIWHYPNQTGAWAAVHWGKWSSWSLLAVMTFTIIVHLKHIKHAVSVIRG